VDAEVLLDIAPKKSDKYTSGGGRRCKRRPTNPPLRRSRVVNRPRREIKPLGSSPESRAVPLEKKRSDEGRDRESGRDKSVAPKSVLLIRRGRGKEQRKNLQHHKRPGTPLLHEMKWGKWQEGQPILCCRTKLSWGPKSEKRSRSSGRRNGYQENSGVDRTERKKGRTRTTGGISEEKKVLPWKSRTRASQGGGQKQQAEYRTNKHNRHLQNDARKEQKSQQSKSQNTHRNEMLRLVGSENGSSPVVRCRSLGKEHRHGTKKKKVRRQK